MRQLEGEKVSDWGSRKRSSVSDSPYTDASVRKAGSSAVGSTSSSHGPPDWTTLRELGSHVVDEDGLSRYMGPSSGVGFVAMVMQELFQNDVPEDSDFHGLFALDDSTRQKWLADADVLLWQVRPEKLPDRNEANRVVDIFFLFTERVYPVLHRSTFKGTVDHLYSLPQMDLDAFEQLAQLYFVLSIGYCFDLRRATEDRVRDQIRALETASRCHFTTLHRKRIGLARLQTLALHSYALLLLRQRSASVEVSATANVLALEIGLHHDGHRMSMKRSRECEELLADVRRWKPSRDGNAAASVLVCVVSHRTAPPSSQAALMGRGTAFFTCVIRPSKVSRGRCTKRIYKLPSQAMWTTTS